MNSSQAAADRRAINAAKQLERASQYGMSTGPATREYNRARAEQARTRREGRA